MFNKKNDVHRSYKKVIGASVACLSIFATIAVGGGDSHATNNLKPQVVQAIEYVAPQASIADKISEESVKYVGTPYVYGGTTTSGMDCSGFTGYAFRAIGINLPRTSGAQSQIDSSAAFAGRTTTITNQKDVQAGDLVFFGKGRVSHVGIALEGNKWVHASTGSKKVIVANRDQYYYQPNFVKAIRINK